MKIANDYENVVASSPWFTKKQAAQYCKVSLRTIDNWMARNHVSYSKLGNVVRFNKETLDADLLRMQTQTISNF